jgi:hypothetical protein
VNLDSVIISHLLDTRHRFFWDDLVNDSATARPLLAVSGHMTGSGVMAENG